MNTVMILSISKLFPDVVPEVKAHVDRNKFLDQQCCCVESHLTLVHHVRLLRSDNIVMW
jgi:hypothetical protein